MQAHCPKTKAAESARREIRRQSGDSDRVDPTTLDRGGQLSHRLANGLSCVVDCGAVRWPEPAEPSLHVQIWLRGHATLRGAASAQRINPHGFVLWRLEPGCPLPTIEASACARHLALSVNCPRLLQLAGDDGRRLLERLTSASEPSMGCASSQLLRSVAELLETLADGSSGSLLRDAKCLELLARLLRAPTQSRAQALTPAQRERVLKAHQLLLADLSSPADARELARSCGLKPFRLKQGFQELYGQSMHQVFQTARMRHAWQLLASGTASVGDAGHAVGYSNLSHFGTAFRAHFGVQPRDLKRCATQGPDAAPIRGGESRHSPALTARCAP